MERKGARRERVLELLEEHGGLVEGAVEATATETGVPAADVYGVATFYTLLARPDVDVRVCQGLSCALYGSDDLVEQVKADGKSCEPVSCLGQCDRAPVAVDGKLELLHADERGGVTPADDALPMNLGGEDRSDYAALAKARELGADAVIDELEASGLQGRGGAGFPMVIKVKSIRSQPETERYVVVNADEGEPGTFKDRECMLRRPHQLIEGLTIACELIGAKKAYIYLRGEFQEPWRRLEAALEASKDQRGELDIELHAGHGAYICGEETALLEALEGRRGMPRLKPPFPTVQGLFGKPTLINNVETLSCVPSIILRGGAWFKGLGRGEAGTKLYCISGHVRRPGVYELPLGATLDELVEAAGGYLGTPKAFSPGGASSGFLPMSFRDTPLDFKSLQQAGTMLGSAGVVVLNDSVNMADAARRQQVFFEDESCGQCAPCRIGCTLQRRALDAHQAGEGDALELSEDIHWEMEQGSICGLGMVASRPLLDAMKYFPEDFGLTPGSANGGEV